MFQQRNLGGVTDCSRCSVLLVAEQRRANESLAAVHTVFQLSRSVVNESLSLQSNLETIEADALAAQQRTSQQYSAVSALSQVNSR